jgi:hypothetical protein
MELSKFDAIDDIERVNNVAEGLSLVRIVGKSIGSNTLLIFLPSESRIKL